jgi:multiple sugar transport system permease protein
VSKRSQGLSDRAIAWLFVAPSIFLLLAVNIFPLIWTVRLSFTNFRVNRPNAEVQFVGLKNYISVLTDGDIWLTMQATAHFLIWTIVLQVLIGFALAYLINKKFRGNDMWTTIIVLPMMLSPAVVGNFWTFLYQPQIGCSIMRSATSPERILPLLDDRRRLAGAMGDRHRRYLDVDALRHADLPGGPAFHPQQYL